MSKRKRHPWDDFERRATFKQGQPLGAVVVCDDCGHTFYAHHYADCPNCERLERRRARG